VSSTSIHGKQPEAWKICTTPLPSRRPGTAGQSYGVERWCLRALWQRRAPKRYGLRYGSGWWERPSAGVERAWEFGSWPRRASAARLARLTDIDTIELKKRSLAALWRCCCARWFARQMSRTLTGWAGRSRSAIISARAALDSSPGIESTNNGRDSRAGNHVHRRSAGQSPWSRTSMS